MSDQMPDEVLIDRRMHAWRPENWHLLDRREGQVRYVRGELYDSKACPHVVGEVTQHCALAQEAVADMAARLAAAEVERDAMIERADRAEADRDTLGAHLERTQARAMKLESKVAGRRALAQWAVDLEAERDRLRDHMDEAIRLLQIRGLTRTAADVQELLEEALSHD